MRSIILVGVVAAAAALAAGCGDSDSDGGTTAATASSNGDAMGAENAAMKDGGAMKDDAMKSDAAMKSDGAMKSGDAMKSDAAMKSGDAMKSSARKGRLIKAVGSEYGKVVADGKGEAFYLFDKEDSSRSECYGICAQAWPPVLTSGKPRAGAGVKAGLLGTTKRKDGKLQVTYAGQPLYYYVDDTPGNILCQNVEEFGGLWLVVKPSGDPVT